MKKAFIAAALAGSAFIAAGANAQNYRLDYTSTDTPGSIASIRITTSTTLNSVGGFDISSAFGTINGSAITSLYTNPNQPNQATSTDGRYFYDNVYFTGNPALSNNGILVNVGSTEYNLFSNGASNYELLAAVNGAFTTDTHGVLTVTSVPEPTTWAMMLIGFGMVGFGLRSRRKQQVRVTYA